MRRFHVDRWAEPDALWSDRGECAPMQESLPEQRLDPPTGCRHCGDHPEGRCCAQAFCAVCGAAHWRAEHRGLEDGR